MKLDLKTRRKSFTLTILTLLIMVCFQALYIHKTIAESTPTVQAPIVLDTGLVSDGDPSTVEFSIDVTIANVEALVAFDFRVYYNTSVLTGVGGEGYYPFTYPLPTIINDTDGYILVGASFPPPETIGFYTVDPYPVMRVDFSVDALGATTLDISRPVFANTAGEEMPLIVIDGYFANTAEIPHDVAVRDIQTSPTRDVMPGEPVFINVTVANQGPFDETFTLTTRADSTTIDSQSTTLNALTETVISIQWNTAGAIIGHYVIAAEASVVPEETDTGDNMRSFSDIVIIGIHDIAVTSVTASPVDVTQGEPVTVEVIVENQGNFTESFNLTAKWGYLPPAPENAPPEIIIGTQPVSSMAAGAKTTLAFTLDTSGVGFLPPHACAFIKVRANASRPQEPAVPYETNTANNWLEMMGYVTVLQSLHDLEASVSAPSKLPISDSSMVGAIVTNRGLVGEKNVELRLMIDDTVINSVEIPELFMGSSYTLNYLWTPPTEGTYNITAYVIPTPDETVVLNNVATAFVKVVTPIYVLFDQTHGCDPVLGYVTWIDSLDARGYFIDTWTDGPITSSVLDKYHIFVVLQARSFYSSSELSAIRAFVESSGGGLLVVGDDWPSIYTGLTDFARLFWATGGVGGSTSDITDHPITKGVNTADFANPLSYIDVFPRALDLIRDSGGYTMLAVSQVGFGKVVALADEQSIDNFDIMMADNSRLANNIIDWLVSPKIPREESTITITASKTTVNLGEAVTISGSITPSRAGASVTLQFKQPWDYQWSDLATVQTDENSQYSYEWTPWMSIYDSSRTYKLRAVWQGDEVTQPAQTEVITIVVIRPPPTISVDPASGQAGTKVTVKGSYFFPDTMVYLMFDDQLVGFIFTEIDGSFNAVFNVPISQAGGHTVKVIMGYYTLMTAEASFTVMDTTSLDFNVDVGTIYFKGETAEFYIQTILNGNPINVTSIKATLYKPDGSTEALAPQRIGTGLYKTQYSLTEKGSMTGTYTLKVGASYDTETINADGTSIKTFIVKPTWEREAPRIAAFSFASVGLVSAMVVLWRREKKKFL